MAACIFFNVSGYWIVRCIVVSWEVEEEMETIGKVVYLLVNGNVYEYDAMAEKRGKYAGRRVENDEGEVSIDKAAAEVL